MGYTIYEGDPQGLTQAIHHDLREKPLVSLLAS